MIPAGINYAPNPSWEGTNAFTSLIRATIALSTTDPWVGDTNLLVTHSSATLNSASTLTPSGSRFAVSEGDEVNISVMVKALQADGHARISVSFYTALSGGSLLGGGGSSGYVAVGEDVYEEISVVGLTAPATATHMELELSGQTTAVSGATLDGHAWRFDGLVIRRNEPVDSYIDGDQGDGYSWVGTPHNSISTRAAGAGEVYLLEYDAPQVVLAWSIYRADKDGTIHEELTEHLLDGFIEMKNDRAIPTQGQIALDDGSLLDPLSDYLFIQMTKSIPPTMESETFNMGLYEVGLPSMTAFWERLEGTFSLRDRTVELAETFLTDSHTYIDGVYAINAASDLADEYGYTLQLPESTVELQVDYTAPVGDSLLVHLNKLMEMANIYPLWVDFESNSFITQPIHDLNTLTPWSSFTPDMLLTEPLIKPVNPTIPNVVLVIKTNSDEAPIVGEYRNDNAGSPTSTVARQREITHVIKDSTIATQAEANLLAFKTWQELDSFNTAVELLVIPDRPPTVHDSLSLTYHNNDMCLCGKYWIRGWRYDMLGSQAMKVSVNRTKEITHE